MIQLIHKCISILVIIKAIIGCGIARFDLYRDFDCGVEGYKIFDSSTFPSGFVGTSSLTLGIWYLVPIQGELQYRLGYSI